MHMHDPYRGKHACTHEQVPSACRVPVIVNGVIVPRRQNLSESARKPLYRGASKAKVVQLRTEVACFCIEDATMTAGQQEIQLAHSGLGP